MIGYVRVSTTEQGASGLGLEAQKASILAAHPAVTEFYTDIMSGSGKKRLTGREQALDHCKRTHEPLVAAKLDRLTRSAVDFYELNEQARKHGFALVLLDVGLDTATPMGEAMAGIVAVFAQLERRRISERTTDALKAVRARGQVLGRPSLIPPEIALEIRLRKQQGEGLRRICADLNARQVPTPRGGLLWRPSSLQHV